MRLIKPDFDLFLPAMRMLIFISVIALANYYVMASLFAFSPYGKVAAWWPLIAALVFFGIEMLDLRTTFFQTWPPLAYFASAMTGAFFCLFFYVFMADVIFLVARWIPAPPLYKVSTFLFWGVIALTVFSVVIGVIQATAGPKIKNVTVALKNLPPAFENYKIVQVSDLHVGGTIRKPYVQNVVNMVNAQNADLIALTGDFADGTVQELKGDSALLGDLKSKDGSYFITGNHEYYHDLGNWMPFYKSLGIHLLGNSHEIIARGTDKLVIAGVTDYSTRHFKTAEKTDIAAAAKDMPQGAVKILLMHQPTQYTDAEKAGFDLQLSGHTHGGQFFPYTMVIGFFHDFYKGLGTYKNLQIYVSVGTGWWGPALRTFNPPEITVLTLKKN